NKDEILSGLVDLVMSEVEPPAASTDWSGSIRSGAISFHEALERHAWAAGLMTKPVALRPGRIGFGESLLARLADAGFADGISFHGSHVLDAWIIGYSLWLAGHSLTPAEREAVTQRLADDRSLGNHPRLLAHHDQHARAGPHQDVSAFEVGLDLILEGLKESAPTKRPSGGSD